MKKLNEVIKQTEERIEQIRAATAAELTELKERKETAQLQSQAAYAEMKAAASSGDTNLYIAKRAERDSAEAVVEMCNMRADDLTNGALISDEQYNGMVNALLAAMETENHKIRTEAAAFFDKAEVERVQLLDNCAAGNRALKLLYAVNNQHGKPAEYDKQLKTGYMITAMLSRADVREIREECGNENK